MGLTNTSTTRLLMLPDFRRGVRFVKGTFADVLEPGSYRINTAKETVTVVDMRPQPMLFERVLYRDALNNPSVISIGADLLVKDPHRAVTTLKDYARDSMPIVQDALQETAAKLVADSSAEGRESVAAAITGAVNEALGKNGLCVTRVEVTELYSQPDPAAVSPSMGIPQ